jgi:DNA-binding transcriptional MerR regulator
MEQSVGGSEGLTVGEVARISGLTVRTLHHYDSIGLLAPSGRSHAGYREYSSADVERLKGIVAYRACGLSLAAIADLLAATGTARAEHLRRQIAMVDQRLADLARQRTTLSTELEAHQMGITLDPGDYFEVFGDTDPRQYADEVRDQWGSTDAYAESTRRTSAYTKEDWLRARAEGGAVLDEFAACMDAGLQPDDSRCMAAAEAHRENISTWYYPCSHEMQVGLADLYVSDPRFTAYYDDVRPGLAAFVHAAIYANAVSR